jgi:quinohemoprotein ethanol dehydrogenase
MKKTPFLVLFVSLTMLCLNCEEQAEKATPGHMAKVTMAVDAEHLGNADATPGDWLSYGRNYSEDRHSALNEIRKDNIDSLGLVWSLNLGTRRGIEATPLAVDGILYLTGPWSVVYAVDARKGELLWTFDPEVPREYGEIACCDVVNRGLALYEGQLFLGALDGRLIAIDAATGSKNWEALTVDQSESYTITGAPRVVAGKVIIGNGGAEYGVRGYVSAYDVKDGSMIWRFYTVPGDPSLPFESKALEEAAKTWTGNWWESGGGGTAWDAFAYDPELNLLYVGVGNGSLWNQDFRSPQGGDNLYLSCILALNPADGSLVWHYQTTPGDTWDYTATQHILLADLEIGGKKRKVLMQAPKNGFFYVLDRVTGDLISAEPYVYVNWATHVELQTGRPVETSFGRYRKVNAEIFPGPAGGHNWQPMAYNPQTNLVYIPARELSMVYGQPREWSYKKGKGQVNLAIGYDKNPRFLADTIAPETQGKLIAWDPVNQREVWSVKHHSPWNAGVLSTPELIFQGTAEGMLLAYDAYKGKPLWQANVHSGVVAPPITYEVDGKQYLTLAAGWGGVLGRSVRFTDQSYPGTLSPLALGAKKATPTFPVLTSTLIDLPSSADSTIIGTGKRMYDQYCQRCHGTPGDGGGAMPDLTFSRAEVFEQFTNIVHDGAYLPKGMPNFGDRLKPEDVNAIKQYILSTAHILRENLAAGENQQADGMH